MNRTFFGNSGKVRGGANHSVVFWIISVNIFVFVASFILSIIFGDAVWNYLALQPSNILQGKYVWTLITHMFMHAGVFHLAVNMFVLYSLGNLSEKIIGRKRFFWFYILSGIFAGLLSVYLAGFYGYGSLVRVFGSPMVYMVGASGAIFAVAGLFVTLLPRMRFSIIFFPFFSLPGYVMVPLVLILTWLASIAVDLPVGNIAHFGGFLFGFVYGYYLRTKYRNKVKLLERYFS